MKKFKMKLYKLLLNVFPRRISSDFMLDVMRQEGIKVGKGTVLFNPSSITIDHTRPELLEIGEYCKITQGTIILTHDYSRSVLRRTFGDIVAEARKTVIGDNVFLGMNSIILMGCNIGDNCIVGAGSVCHGQYPSNSVIAGNPARVIMTLDEYYKKRKNKYIIEAKDYVHIFEEYYHRLPSQEEMKYFFPLYTDRSLEAIDKLHLNLNLSGDCREEIIRQFLVSEPVYKSYEEFLNNAMK